MKFFLVSRKKYQAAQDNFIMCYNRKKELTTENVILQKKNKELKEEIDKLKVDCKELCKMVELYRGKQKPIRNCAKCKELFVPKTSSQVNCQKCIDKRKGGK